MKLHKFVFCCSVFAAIIVIGGASASDFLEPVVNSAPQTVKIEKSTVGAAPKVKDACGDTCYKTVDTLVQTVPPTNPRRERIASTVELSAPGNCDTPDAVVTVNPGTPLWYGPPKARNTNRELVKTVDIEGVPWWDDSVSHHDKVAFQDDFVYTTNPDGNDWNWWVEKGFGPKDNRYPKPGDWNWAPDVDYYHFEYMTSEELEHRRALAEAGGYIDPWVEFYKKRSCPPWMDLDTCKQWMSTPHFVEDLPAVAPQTPLLAEHDRYTQRAVEDLFLNPQTPNSYWVNGMQNDVSRENVQIQFRDVGRPNVNIATVPAFRSGDMALAAPVTPSVALLSDFQTVPVASFVGQKTTPATFVAADKAADCREPGQVVNIETCQGTRCVECPFDTMWECEIWLNKPHVREAIAPRTRRLRQVNIDSLVALLQAGNEISVEMQDARPLVKRYEKLMTMSRVCCTEGIVHNLRRAGATPGLVYKFLVDDANFYGFGDRCLMMSDDDLDRYRNTATASVVADVRNGCLCRQKEQFKALLAPFQQVGEQVPGFSASKFSYTFTDGLQREVTTSITQDVKNVLQQLDRCP